MKANLSLKAGGGVTAVRIDCWSVAGVESGSLRCASAVYSGVDVCLTGNGDGGMQDGFVMGIVERESLPGFRIDIL